MQILCTQTFEKGIEIDENLYTILPLGNLYIVLKSLFCDEINMHNEQNCNNIIKCKQYY